MQGLTSILSLFRNKFNKFNNTGARIYLSHDIRITLKSHLCHLLRKIYNERHCSTLLNLFTTSGSSILLHDIISLSDSTS